MGIPVQADGKTNYYRNYADSQRGQRTEAIVLELLRESHNAEETTHSENLREDIDFRMDWQGERIVVSLKDESKAPLYAEKRKAKPDLYFETYRHNRTTGEWEKSDWFKKSATHYMIAWWLHNSTVLELRIYRKESIYAYLVSRVQEGFSQGWHKLHDLNPWTARTQTGKYDNARCGFIPFDAVGHDVLRFGYTPEGTLEAI